MRVNIEEKIKCCGCTACSTVCPKKAITMTPDVMGFLYPVIDDSVCIDCGLCLKTCQFNDEYNRYQNFERPIVYGVRYKNEKELEFSQSGAASWAIIEAFLLKDGSVYGASFDTVYHVVHSKATTISEAQKFRCSKYVQSDMRDVYTEIKDELKEGRRVLFFGTGCQVAGLKSALPIKLHEHLLAVDIVCHATPAPAVWESFVRYIEKKHNSKVIKTAFRNKKYGWHSHIETLLLEKDNKEVESTSFRKLFYDHVIVRPSCTKCHFTNLKRVGDMTICDFWGWEKHYTEWNDNKGVSVLMLNSEKGVSFFETIKPFILYKESDTEKCVQPQMKTPITANMSIISDAEKVFAKKGYLGLAKKYGDQSLVFLFKEAVRPALHFLRIR